MTISDHITYAEAVKSQEAVRLRIRNVPNQKQLAAMRLVAEKCFEPVRNHFKVPIGISSFFRSEALNELIGGSKTSQHCKGEAIDIDADIFGKISNSEIFHFIYNNLEFDQLIWEYGDDENPAWVHVSYAEGKNRKQVLKITKKGTTVFKP
jgi:hypothetical protein